MLQPSCHLSTQHVFGVSADQWYTLSDSDIQDLKIPRHLSDQVFQISICPVKSENLHFFECLVSEQFPKESYRKVIQAIIHRCGERTILSFLHRGSLGIHIAIGSSSTCYHLDMDLNRLSSFDRQLLKVLQTPDLNRYNRILSQVGSDPLGKDLFKLLRNFLTQLPKKNLVQHRVLVDLLLKLIFLVFVQKKGWLNFDPHYLERHMLRCKRGGLSILHLLLKPLFARLNGTPIGEPIRLGNLPTLKGGLFTFHPEALPKIDNSLLLNLLESLLDSFSFTLFEVGENASPLGITPEVLGTVFENLMDSRDRKAYGVYFTPSEVARRQVASSFNILQSHSKPTLKWLKNLRILDPSCGSGTYLVAAFQKLLELRLQFVPENERYNGHLFGLKSEIVLNNLFGMDINPLAVRLTEVRLWLNMIQDLEIKDPESAPQLPHLQHHLRAGDFLSIPPSWDGNLLRSWPKYKAYKKVKQSFQKSTDRQKYLQHLYRLEREFQDYSRSRKQKEILASQSEARKQQTLPGFEKTSTLKPRDPLGGKMISHEDEPCTGPHIAFCEEILKGGFHLVIGNPPWLASRKIPSSQKQKAQLLLRTSSGFRCHGQMDLSLYFSVFAMNNLVDNGHLSFLLPGKFLQADYGATLRQRIRNQYQLDYILDYGLKQGFLFQADTFPVVLGVSNRRENIRADCRVQIERRGPGLFEPYTLPLNFFPAQGDPWMIPPKEDLPNLEHYTLWPKLDDFPFTIRRGLVTGNKRLFTFSNLPPELPKDWLKPLITGRSLQDKTVNPTGWVLYPFEEHQTKQMALPSQLAKHLQRHRKDSSYTKLPFSPLDGIKSPYRVIWRYLDRKLRAWVLGPGSDNSKPDSTRSWIPDQTTYFIPCQNREDALRLLYILNAPSTDTQIRALAERGNDGYVFLYAQTIKRIRIPPDLMDSHPSLLSIANILYPHDVPKIQWQKPWKHPR